MRINDAGLQEAIVDLRSLATSPGTQRNYLELALGIICLGLEVPLGKILELDRGGKNLLVRAGVGWKEGIIGQVFVLADARSVAGYTLGQTGVVVFDDGKDMSWFSGAHLLFSQDVRSTMAIRIVCQGKPWGVLTIHERIRRHFTLQEIRFLQDAALYLGSLIDAREGVRTT